MLQEIRERAQGWVAWAIIILISIPFAFWGIDSYFGGGAEPVVASVNGADITERAFNQNVNRTRIQLRDRLGDAYDPALFDDLRIRQQVLERMIRETLLLEDSAAMGLRTSDQAIRAAILSEPAFQQDGGFSNAQYEQVLRLQGLTPAAYEDSLRSELLLSQLPRAIRETAFVTDALADRSASLVHQERIVAYATVPQSSFAGTVESPTDEAVAAYYDGHQDQFATPEQVRISYLLLNAAALSRPDQSIDEASLRERYELRLDEFTAPEERKVRHILLSVPVDADRKVLDETRKRLQEVQQRITAGEPFAALAAEVSEDPGSAEQGGELGWVGRDALDPAFEQAVFTIEPETLSEPVRSRFGYHLVEVLEVRGGEPKPFEAVKEELIADLNSGSSEAAFFEQAEQLATLTYESPDSLIPAAETLGLEVQLSDWIDRSGGEGLFANPRVVGAAFSEEVLALGNNSELLEPDPEAMQALVLRVAEHREPSVRPLDEVRDEIVTLLETQQAADAAKAEAEAIVARVEGGQELAAAAEGFDVVDAGQIGRVATEPPPEVTQLAFSLPPPAADAALRVGSTTASDSGDAYVVVVSEVKEGDPSQLDPTELEAEARMLTRALAAADVDAVLAAMQARAKIERKPIVTDEPF
ncbi:SurA N-terminal domain-containing protein [Lamprobacter modestohalophilus]|uniref:SurA N-terminal domain-containing protein n=1 Tax=Lamprobacter modestohalophilus TaxID=1064514 RepID=UPI002ADEEC72|nr:SurA N-terminal domain-containing protein [Lamprobacter modestohalophilus]MEA1050276.1 SurA N-terminal domain-containing protein [Lamprobacter modestohalophilus]